MRSALGVLAGACVALGCQSGPWIQPEVPAREPAAFQPVYFKDEVLPAAGLVRKGPVEVEIRIPRTALSSRAACGELTQQAMLELLRQSRALGGNAVYDVQAKGSWSWSDEPICRNVLDTQRGARLGVKAHVIRLRGQAVHDPSLHAAAVGDG